jgi:hypothetical protein
MNLNTSTWATPLSKKQELLVSSLYDQLGVDGDTFINNLKRSVTPVDSIRLITEAVKQCKPRRGRCHGDIFDDYWGGDDNYDQYEYF